jgi:8-oxo-dGTP pyrophosphatase MutT (NUDIX family)
MVTPTQPGRTYTDPSVLAGIAAGASWADPEMDPTRIDWAARLATAAIPFVIIDGRPVSPGAPTGIRYGRNELGHWGEQLCADALVTSYDQDGGWWLVMVERSDGHGWALPGGYVDPADASPYWAAVRELREETGLIIRPGVEFQTLRPRLVPDPRASDEAWMVTVPTQFAFGPSRPPVVGADDARQAAWVRATTYAELVEHLAAKHDGGTVFPSHRALLSELLG